MSSWCLDGQCQPWGEHHCIGLGEDESTPNSCCSGGVAAMGQAGAGTRIWDICRGGVSKLTLCPHKEHWGWVAPCPRSVFL